MTKNHQLQKKNNKHKQVPVSRNVTVQQAHYQGPLPLPNHFEGYERVLPGSAERIIAMAEKEQDHRIGQEKQALVIQDRMIDEDIKMRNKSLNLTVFAVLPICFSASVGLALCKAFVASGIVGGTTVVSIVSATLLGKYLNRDKEEK